LLPLPVPPNGPSRAGSPACAKNSVNPFSGISLIRAMNTEDLLNELTPSAGSADFLIAAAHTRARRRCLVLESAAATSFLMLAMAGIVWLLPKSSAPPSVAVSAAQMPPPLTDDELLDSFGDQPVALVTYPDGSQRLLAALRPLPGRGK